MATNRKYHSNVSFLDLLFNLVVGFVMLFIIAFILIRPITENKQIEQKAEYIITVTWPEEYYDDVDVWLRNPNEEVVSFKQTEIGLMHLDRDDLGKANDTEWVNGVGEVVYPYNREIVTVRGYIPGEYILNIHLYKQIAYTTGVKPVPVTVSVEKINPRVTPILKEEFVLTTAWEEQTVLRFTLNRDGEIESISRDFFPLVKTEIERHNPMPMQPLSNSDPNAYELWAPTTTGIGR
jgi:hypothetical protein